MMIDENGYEVEEQGGKKHSVAKSMVAQQKPRDAEGKFLSGAELQNYRAQQQAQQFAAERNRMNTLLGRSSSIQSQNQQQSIPLQQFPQSSIQNNFEAILAANKPGGATLSEGDKWDVLLGKKRRQI